jgi:hypothetical protein
MRTTKSVPPQLRIKRKRNVSHVQEVKIILALVMRQCDGRERFNVLVSYRFESRVISNQIDSLSVPFRSRPEDLYKGRFQ